MRRSIYLSRDIIVLTRTPPDWERNCKMDKLECQSALFTTSNGWKPLRWAPKEVLEMRCMAMPVN